MRYQTYNDLDDVNGKNAKDDLEFDQPIEQPIEDAICKVKIEKIPVSKIEFIIEKEK